METFKLEKKRSSQLKCGRNLYSRMTIIYGIIKNNNGKNQTN